MANTKQLLASMLLEASSAETDVNTLSRIWDATNSVKIRKAIASNPNCSPSLLYKAARLYLEEVLQNPAFEVASLFQTDEWIEKITLAYQNPGQTINAGLISPWTMTTRVKDSYCTACLFSKNLDGYSMVYVTRSISSTAFKRALKSPGMKEKLRNIFVSEVRSKTVATHDLETSFKFYLHGVLSEEELIEFFNVLLPGSVSTPRHLYKRFCLSIFKKYDKEKDKQKRSSITDLIATLVHKSRTHVVSSLNSIKNFGAKDYILEQKTKERYINFLVEVAKRYREKYKVEKGYSTRHIQELLDPLTTRIHDKSINNVITLQDLNNIRSIAEYINLTYSPEIWGKILVRPNFYSQCLQLPIETKCFLAFNYVFGDWLIPKNFEDPRVKIFNEVNEYQYKKYGPDPSKLLFSECKMKNIASLNKSSRIHDLSNVLL